MRRREYAFTLIELLTVIAIIAILAAIIFPVFARARDSAYRNGDISAMNSLRTALQLYRVDQGGYPPALLGYATLYANSTNVVPADQIQGFLYPKRVDGISSLQPAYARFSRTDIGTAVWPNQDGRAVGSAPVADLNGDGRIDGNDDPSGSRQAFGPNVTVLRAPGAPAGPNNPPAQFYKVSGYDMAEVPVAGGGRRNELRYALFWTQDGIGGGSASDDPRQLGYSDPPDNTVMTWNSFFRDWENGVPQRNRRDLVLFLGGSARAADSRDVHDRSWRVTP